MDALVELEQWKRKYYTYEITSDPFGDGPCVTLSTGYRKVTVDALDLTRWGEGDEEDYWPTLSDVITEALRKWHADSAPKWFHLLWWDSQEPPVEARPWIPGRSWVTDIVAGTQAEAEEKIYKAYQECGRKPEHLSIWERGSAKRPNLKNFKGNYTGV